MNKQKVVLIHTSFVFFERERLLFELFDEILPDVERINIVEDKMLAEVMTLGFIPPEATRRMCHYVLAAESMGADVIFNTCSSLGPAFDVAKQMVRVPAIKIDDAMADAAASQGNKIAVLATVSTTLGPTVDLINDKARKNNKQIETKKVLAEGAFDILMGGDVVRHDEMVAQKAKEASGWANTLVLAQCSMARLAPRLAEETDLPVFSSPQLGVRSVKQVLESIK